ncbi:MAG TPA: hypothetical protein VHJ82_05615 [Actinomycetota bacterium]|nr:hypothetical protein [Actinomycetota bacterium]
MRTDQSRDTLGAEARWTLGCLVASVALTGLLILVLLVAIAISPPVWIQVLLGVGLALGGALLAWLVATALKARGQTGDGPDVVALPKERPARREPSETPR